MLAAVAGQSQAQEKHRDQRRDADPHHARDQRRPAQRPGHIGEGLRRVPGHREHGAAGESLRIVGSDGIDVQAWPDVGVEDVADGPRGDLATQFRGVSAAGCVLIDATDRQGHGLPVGLH